MVIGVCKIELRLSGIASLKAKRSALKPLLFRLRKEFNVSSAEVEHHDIWQAAMVAVAIVSTEAGHAESTLERVARWVEHSRPDLDVVDHSIEVIHC